MDEVERIQLGIDEGWGDGAFLDFARAAGDSLSRIRLLLVSAWPLQQLGDHWVDRLISAHMRLVGRLNDADTRALVTDPLKDSPVEHFPAPIVDGIAAATAGHPFLTQLVCLRLAQALNKEKRLAAEPDDLEAVLDEVAGNSLFRELWTKRTEAERALLVQALETPLPLDDPTVRRLVEWDYLAKDGDVARIAVPLFAAWIREHEA